MRAERSKLINCTLNSRGVVRILVERKYLSKNYSTYTFEKIFKNIYIKFFTKF